MSYFDKWRQPPSAYHEELALPVPPPDYGPNPITLHSGLIVARIDHDRICAAIRKSDSFFYEQDVPPILAQLLRLPRHIIAAVWREQYIVRRVGA